MVIDQRNGGASLAITNGDWSLDRWQFEAASSGKLTAQKSSVAPAGFTNSLLITCVSSYTLGSTDSYLVRQHIEGYNFADLGWGTSDAQPVTLSFRVRSSITGTFGGAFRNNDNNRSYPFSYTISASNTWETKTVTITPPTDGNWEKTTARGVTVMFSFGTGSSNSAAAGAWANDNYQSATGAGSLGTSGATMYITGVQVEKGREATNFDYRPYGTELAMCQRYYWEKNASTGNTTQWNLHWYSSKSRIAITTPVPMRAAITATFTGSTSGAFFSTNDDSNYRNFSYVGAYSEFNNGYPTLNISLNDSGGGAATTGGGIAYIQNDRKIAFSAEL
jgi:hypothetical protein